MAAVAENAIGSEEQFLHRPSSAAAADCKSDSKSDFQCEVRKLVELLSKLNPSAKEFFPSYYSGASGDRPQSDVGNQDSVGDTSSKNRRKKNNYSQWKRRLNGRALRAQREDSIRRTVYVADIDQHVTEERLAALFINCGQVVDCRICGDPHSILRFAFVEFADEQGARAALNLSGTVLGFYPVRVLPSKTAILPVNPTFLPRSEDEREMCARTVYCTNIDKKVTQMDVKLFFESFCGEVSRLRLLGDHVHSTRIAFVEFVLYCLSVGLQYPVGHHKRTFVLLTEEHCLGMTRDINIAVADSAIAALGCSGSFLGALPIRVSPSKTPVRPRIPRAM